MVLTAGVIAKGALVFILAQIRDNSRRQLKFCSNATLGLDSNKEYFVTFNEHTQVAWLW